MKVVIMAAGKGTRMLSLTEKTPKVLVEVNGKPFLYYVLKSLGLAGYTEIGIIVGYMGEKIGEFLQEYGFKATLIEQKEQKGTGHAVLQARKFVGKENFVVLGGDNLWGVDDLKAIGKHDELNYVSGVRVEDTQRYGVIITEKNYLKEIREKPKEDCGKLINTGLYQFTPEIFSKLEKVTVSPRGEIELTDAITMLAKEGKVKVLQAKWWLDLGSKEDIPKVEMFLRKEKI